MRIALTTLPVCAAGALSLSGCVSTTRIPAPPEPPRPWGLESGWLTMPGIARAVEGSAANVQVAGRGPFPATPEAAPDETSTDPAKIVAVYRTEHARLEDICEPFPALGPAGIRRRLRYTNTSGEPQDVTNFTMSIASADGTVSWAPPWSRMVRVDDERLLCVANWGETDLHGFEGGPGPIRSRFRAAWRLAPGQTATVGYQGIWLGNATAPDATRKEARRWYHAHGCQSPLQYPQWLTHGVLYEASAAGHIDSRFSDTGGFDTFSKQVPYLADLGITALWLNAVQEHKSSPNPVDGGWNHYAPRDFLRVDPILGGDEGLRRLGNCLESNGVHLISEIVPHGGSSRQAQALPDWWTRDRDGGFRKNWGGCGMDNASPQWQAALRSSMAMVSRLAHVEGARIDVADGQGPNWGSTQTNHASYSTLRAALEVQQAVAEGIAVGGAEDIVLIPETAARPEFFAQSGRAVVLGYGFETTHFLERLPASMLADPVGLNERLHRHFEDQRGVLPPGALVVQSLNNHDTVCHLGRARFRFGVGLHRALYAVCLSVPGVPMMYQEEEVGAFFALRRLNHVRRLLPALATGDVRYPDPGWFEPGVFAAWRRQGKQRVLCLVNLSGNVVSGCLTRGPEMRAKLLTDVLSGRPVAFHGAEGALTLGPYQAAFLVPGAARTVDTTLPAPRFAGEAAPPAGTEADTQTTQITAEGVARVQAFGVSVEVDTTGVPWSEERAEVDDGARHFTSTAGSLKCRLRQDGGVDVRCELHDAGPGAMVRLKCRGLDEWGVTGRTGSLHDRFLRRHYPFPADSGYTWRREHIWGHMPWAGLYRGVCPSGRLWQSVVEPLHPEQPVLAFTGRDGRGIAITEIESNAMNVVLTDCTDEAAVSPLRLETRFLAVDDDLHPNVQQLGLGQPWRVSGLAHAAGRPLSVSFAVRPVSTGVADLLAAEPLPFEPPGASETHEGEGTNELGGRIFLPRPGMMTWSNLAPVNGSFRIRLELRLSERSGEDEDLKNGYCVRLNDQELPLEWTKKNVWQTGNAYFAHALTPPVDLSRGPHELTIRTRKTWCAMGRSFHLTRAE